MARKGRCAQRPVNGLTLKRHCRRGIAATFHRAEGSVVLVPLLPGPAGFLAHTLPVPCLGLEITRTTVVAKAAASTVLAIPPTAGLDRPVVFSAEALSRWWNFETKHATLIAIARPPPPAQDGKPVFFAKSFAGRWHFRGSIALTAAGVAMAGAPVTRSDGPAVNLAKVLLG